MRGKENCSPTSRSKKQNKSICKENPADKLTPKRRRALFANDATVLSSFVEGRPDHLSYT